MPVPTTITDLSTTAASNSPAGSETVTTSTGPDDYIRAVSAIVKREQTKGANVASAATVNLGAIADGNYVHITGAITITAFGTIAAGISRTLVFDGILTLTHNATSLILPGGANITTAAGDVAVMISEGSGNWRCVAYVPASGYITASAVSAAYAALAGATFTGLVNLKTGANIASAATVNLSTATGNLVHITGTTATSAVTMTSGQHMRCVADAAWPLTYHATTNRINGGVSYTCEAGDTIDYFYDGTTVFGNITKKDGKAVAANAAIRDISRGLVIKNNVTNPNFQLDISASELVLSNGTGSYFATTISETVSITTSGASGLDTGTEANSTWYYVWIIFNGTTVDALLSASSTAPTMPSGYTYKALVGAIYNNALGNFIAIHQVGSNVSCTKGAVFTNIAASVGDTYQSISLAGWIPLTAKKAIGMGGSTASATAGVSAVAATSAGLGEFFSYGYPNTAGNWYGYAMCFGFGIPVTEPQLIYWKSAGTAATSKLDITGWEY